jgi:hypothetical protein
MVSMRGNNSAEYVSDEGASVNQAESFFSRLRRAEYGVHHRISGQYLYQYANEVAWREYNRRIPNGMQWPWIASAALRSSGRSASSVPSLSERRPRNRGLYQPEASSTNVHARPVVPMGKTMGRFRRPPLIV